MDVFGKRVPEGEGSYGKVPVTPDPVLGPEWWGQEVGVRVKGAVERSVEKVAKVGGGLVLQCSGSEENKFS